MECWLASIRMRDVDALENMADGYVRGVGQLIWTVSHSGRQREAVQFMARFLDKADESHQLRKEES